MGRKYAVPLRISGAPLSVTTNSSNPQDIFELKPAASDRGIILHGFRLMSAQGATAAENATLSLVYRTADGTGGTSLSRNELSRGNTASPGFTATGLRTTPGTEGEFIDGWIWTQQGELLYLPTPELRPDAVPGGDRICLLLSTTLGGTRTWYGAAWVEEE
jgi:hypothetical protein